MTHRYLAMLAALMPAGVFGLSVALASAADAKVSPAVPEADVPSVASRLAEIRQAVSDAVEAEGEASPIQIAWHGWGNGGWHGRWGNGGGWHNGGWHNGGWGNGGWGNIAIPPIWGNGGWHNWHNHWGNW